MSISLQNQNFVNQSCNFFKIHGQLKIDGKTYPISLDLSKVDAKVQVVASILISFAAVYILNQVLSANKSSLSTSYPSDILKEVSQPSSPVDVVGLPEDTQNNLDRCIKLFLNTKKQKIENLPKGHTFKKNLLFVGPPGNGKTKYLEKLKAQYSDLNCFKVDGTLIQGIYVGSGTRNLEDTFKEIHRQASKGYVCIFIDEFEALAPRRKESTNGSNEQVKVVDKLLMELNRLPDNAMLIAATNCPDMLDDAVIRAGRFDVTIEFPQPDVNAIQAILTHYLKFYFPSYNSTTELLILSQFIDNLGTVEGGVTFSAADLESGVKELYDKKILELVEREKEGSSIDGSNLIVTTEDLKKVFSDLLVVKKNKKMRFVS